MQSNMTSKGAAMKFLWNGIKSNGKLHRAWYSDGCLVGYPHGTLTIYAKDYSGFNAEIRAAFDVQNATDYSTDYFEKDKIRLLPDHPLHATIAVLIATNKARDEKRYEKRKAAA